MTGMSCLLICALAVNDGGWQSASGANAGAGQRNAAASGQPGSGLVRSAESTLWKEIENALDAPADATDQSATSFPRLRPADGSDPPPLPPGARANRASSPSVSQDVAQNRQREHLLEPPGLVDLDQVDPRDDAEIVFERRWNDRSERQYIVPPPRELTDEPATGDVIPLPRSAERELQEMTQSDSVQPLPSSDRAAEGGGTMASASGPSIDEGRSPPSEQTEALRSGSVSSPRWWPLTLTMLALFASLGFNVYLGWMAWDIHGRYLDVVDEVRELERRLDEGDRVHDESTREERLRVS